MNWLPAQAAWQAIECRKKLTSEYMQAHWDKIQHWKNRKPLVGARGSRKEGGTHGNGHRPIMFSLTPDNPKKQLTTPALPEKAVNNMKRNEAFPSKFLKTSDLNGGDLAVTISSVEWEEVGQEKTQKPVIYFRGKIKPLICNGTNWDSIVKVAGEDDSDEWDGKRITLYPTEVPFGAKQVEAIRVREPKTVKGKRATAEKVTDPEDD